MKKWINFKDEMPPLHTVIKAEIDQEVRAKHNLNAGSVFEIPEFLSLKLSSPEECLKEDDKILWSIQEGNYRGCTIEQGDLSCWEKEVTEQIEILNNLSRLKNLDI